MKNIISKIHPRQLIRIAFNHKIWSTIIIICILGGGYWAYAAMSGDETVTRYVFANVTRGTLADTISGSGQISALNQTDIKAKASGDIVYVGVENGQEIKAGTVIAQIDTTEAAKTVRDAEISLKSTELTIEKQNLTHEQDLRGDSLNQNLDQGMSALATFYGGTANMIDSIYSIAFDTEVSGGYDSNITYYSRYNSAFSNYPEKVGVLYQEIKNTYPSSVAAFQTAKTGDNASREIAIRKGNELATKLTEIVKMERDVIRSLGDTLTYASSTHLKQTIINNHVSEIDSLATTLDTNYKAILSVVNELNSNDDSLDSYEYDSKSSDLTLQQKKNALADARSNLSDYYIVAPTDGTLADFDLEKGDTVSSGTTIAVIITQERLATISLNEVDAVKVKKGQKAELTFDAVDDLKIKGEVIDVDLIGTVSQGVVNYNVKIKLLENNEKIRPGMSVDAVITVDSKENVLVVPLSAVKTSNGESYVEIVDMAGIVGGPGISTSTQNFTNQSSSITPNLKNIKVVTGKSNDTEIEIVSGLNEGDKIVSRTISGSTSATSATSQSSGMFGGGGGTRSVMSGAGAGAVRVIK